MLDFLGPAIPFILMFLIMYFLIIRPQRKQQKDFDSMIENLKKGDRILTRGGIYCVILDFAGEDKQKVLVDAGNNVKIHISKNYIAALVNKDKKTKKSEESLYKK